MRLRETRDLVLVIGLVLFASPAVAASATLALPTPEVRESPALRGPLSFSQALGGNFCSNSSIPGTFIEYDRLGNGPDWDPKGTTDRCQNAFYCFTPVLGAPQYSVPPDRL